LRFTEGFVLRDIKDRHLPGLRASRRETAFDACTPTSIHGQTIVV
jgi:hypothetical protein